MNYGRLALAAVVATVVDAVYGFLVWGTLLAGEFSRYLYVFRPPEVGASYMPFLFLGVLLAMFVAAYIYAKGYEGGAGLQEGMRFGVCLGFFVVGAFYVVDYAILNIGRKLAVFMAIAGFVEWVIAGTVIGALYKPAGTSSRR
jgi:hypothetical protein